MNQIISLSRQSISIFGLTFYWYGLIIGLALVIGWQLAEYRLHKEVNEISSDQFFKLVMAALVSGLLGARLWHVITDYQLYVDNWVGAFYVWQGGLSILGAVLGGVIGLYVAGRKMKVSGWPASMLTLTDAVIFGMPIAQGIGRLGNFVNQELYGFPTDLPWGLWIDPAYRLRGYEAITHFHPLFAYEMLFTLGFGVVLWAVHAQKKLKIGTGFVTVLYLGYYSLVRFLLDFIRIEKSYWFGLPLGINQLILIACIGWAGWWLGRFIRDDKPIFAR